MFTVSRGVENTAERIFNPAAEQIVRETILGLGLHRIFGDNIHAQGISDSRSTTVDSNNNPILETENRVTYSLEYSVNPENMDWGEGHTRDRWRYTHTVRDLEGRNPVLFDPASGSYLTEVMKPCKLTIECRFIVSDKSIANMILTAVHNQLNSGSMTEYMNVIYDYPIPADIFTLLYMISKLQGYGQVRFEEFLQRHSGGYISMLQNKHTRRREPIIRKKFDGIHLLYNCGLDQPEPMEHEQANTAYAVDFEIISQLRYPAVSVIRYPIIINNNLIPSEGVQTTVEQRYAPKPAESPFFDDNNWRRVLESETPTYIPVIRTPWYDNWNIPDHHVVYRLGYRAYAIMAFLLNDPDNPESVTTHDLKNLGGEFNLTQPVLDELMSGEYNPLYLIGKYHIGVFADDIMVEPSIMTFENGILTVPNRHKHKIFRLVLSVNEDKFALMARSMRVLVVDIITNRNFGGNQ